MRIVVKPAMIAAVCLEATRMKTKVPARSVLAGIWHNQHNSQMHLEIDESGKIAGSFINGISATGGRSETFPVTGFAREDVFAFCVDFSKYGCMTTWVGQVLDPDTKRFQAMWQMIADVHRHEELAWKSIWIGQDVFEVGARETEISTATTPASHPLHCTII
jgi:hypothetical protein